MPPLARSAKVQEFECYILHVVFILENDKRTDNSVGTGNLKVCFSTQPNFLINEVGLVVFFYCFVKEFSLNKGFDKPEAKQPRAVCTF